MVERPEVFFCIRPKDPLMDRSTLKRRLQALDEAFTESLPGGLGAYRVDHECSEVWLYDRTLEGDALAMIAEHGFELCGEQDLPDRRG